MLKNRSFECGYIIFPSSWLFLLTDVKYVIEFYIEFYIGISGCKSILPPVFFQYPARNTLLHACNFYDVNAEINQNS